MMLSDLGTWFRITDIADDDERLRARRHASEALADELEKPGSRFGGSLVVASGLSILDSSRMAPELLNACLDRIAEAMPSVDRDRVSMTLEPGLCWLVATSEVIHRRLQKPARIRRTEPAVRLAAAVCSAARFRGGGAREHLDAPLDKLLQTAEALLEKVEASRRTRKTRLTTIPGSETGAPEAGAALNKVVELVKQLAADAELDREELNALWWVVGGWSLTASKPFAEIPPKEAAVRAGIELATLVSDPGTRGTAWLATRVASAAQEADEGAEISSEARDEFLHATCDVQEFAAACFPLRQYLLSASQQSASVVDVAALSPSQLARQAYAEAALARAS